MIHVIDDLHLNDFKEVHCPKGRDIFARCGKREIVASPSSEDIIPMNMNKLDSLAYMQQYDAYMQSLESSKQEETKQEETKQEETKQEESKLEDE